MTFLEPAWLVLAIPLGFALWRWPPPRGWRRNLRLALFAVLVLALARPAVLLPRRGGTLVVVVDRSASMPDGSAEVGEEIVRRLEASRPRGDALAVVSFGARAAVESAGEGALFQGFSAEVGREASDLAEALDTALGLLPTGEDGSGRLLLVTDGRWTGRDPKAVASRATLRRVPIDYRLLERPTTRDLAVDRLDAPGQVSPGEGFVITAWVRSPVRQEVEVVLRRGEAVLAAGRRRLPAGRSRFTFRDRGESSGVQSYTLTVRRAEESAEADPVPENDTARFLVGVRGPRPLLLVAAAPTRTAELLRRGGLEIDAVTPRQLSGTLEDLAAYSAVVLENVPAEELGELALENLAVWVRSAGGGLIMTGGKQSFGPGGYFRSPIEEVLPVSMELRQEHRKMALAMVVALDRSGSMAASVGGGRTKMDLANLATAEVLDLLSPFDELGVVAVDSSPHVVVPLSPVDDKDEKRRRILSIDSQGGGIFVYTALQAAVEQLLRSQAGARHILLFADAADAEEPGDYVELLKLCRESEITVSVVGLGTDADADAAFLRDVAQRGEGQVFFTVSPEALPRLFAQDTFVIARSTFVDQPTPVRFTAGLRTLSGQPFGEPPPLGGYNLTYLRPGANLAAVSRDEYEAPVIAAWQAGLGRAVAYTGEVDGAHSGAIAGWPGIGELLASLARWTAGESNELPRDVLVTQEFRRGALRLRVHLDPERQGDPFARLPRATTVRGVPGKIPVTEETALRWTDPDTLEAVVELAGDEVALARVEVPGLGGVALAPARLPYATEYEPAEPGAGHLILERLARITGGHQRIDVSDVWRDFERRPRAVELAPWLLALALVLLLAEVLERRTALLSTGRWPLRVRRKVEARPKRRRVEVRRPTAAEEKTPEEERRTTKPAEQDGVLSALDRARQRAGRRTRR